jgi:CpeT protein
MKPIYWLLLLFIPLTATASDDYEILTQWMTGSFSSQQQAEADSDFFDIRLKMIRIWPERGDGYWLYVEQAVAAYENKPYRQRVYRVTAEDGGRFISRVFTLEKPLRFAGWWQTPEQFSVLTPDSLQLRDGCAITLQRIGETFTGSTTGTGCSSNLRGAAYATSEVRITAGQIYSWDRGFAADGKQVWGAEKGGYMFKKLPER